MAINPNTEYAGRVTAPSSAYPYGSSKNETSPGAGDGTPYELARANDVLGMQQALLKSAGITPSGNADEVGTSEYVQAIVEEAMGRGSYMVESGGSAADVYIVEAATDNEKPRSYFENMTVVFRAAVTNTGASTIDVAGLGVKAIRDSNGAVLIIGAISAINANVLVYDAVNGWFLLSPPPISSVQACKAWVQFSANGGTVTVNASFNVASVVRNGLGDFTITFTNAMADTNFVVSGSCNKDITGLWNRSFSSPYLQAPTASTVRIATYIASSPGLEDMDYVSIQIFGN